MKTRVVFIGFVGNTFATFIRELDALRWAKNHPGAKIDTVFV